MSTSVTLNDLRGAVLNAANMENSTFVATAPVGSSELDRYINQSWFELYEMMCGKGAEYFLASFAVAITSGTDRYALPADFYKLRGVDVSVGGQTWDALPFVFNERNKYKNFVVWNFGDPIRYRVEAGSIVYMPSPTGSFESTIWYYPSPVPFTSGAQAQDFVAGWDEYVIVDAAIKCLRKEESDASLLMAQKAELKTRIEASIPTRDAAHPETVTIVRGRGRSRMLF